MRCLRPSRHRRASCRPLRVQWTWERTSWRQQGRKWRSRRQMTRLWLWSAGRRRAGRRGWLARSSTEPSRIRTRHRCRRIRQCRRLSVSVHCYLQQRRAYDAEARRLPASYSLATSRLSLSSSFTVPSAQLVRRKSTLRWGQLCVIVCSVSLSALRP